jgi:hypothetical protein
MKSSKQSQKTEQPSASADKKTLLFDSIGAFTTMPNSVIEMWPIIGNDAICLFLYLRYRAGSKSYCYPSYETIMKDTCLTRQRVCDSIKVLIKHGLMDRKKRFSGSTVYVLKMPPIRLPVEIMDEKAPLVDPSNDISLPPELPLVDPSNSNKIHINKIQNNKTQEEDAPVGAPVCPSSSGKRRTQATKKGDGVDMALDQQLLREPAVIAYREVARLTLPIQLRQMVVDEVKDVELWKAVILHWIGHGWNKQNVRGLLDSYANGGQATCHLCNSTAFPKKGRANSTSQQREALTEQEIADFQAKLFGASTLTA